MDMTESKIFLMLDTLLPTFPCAVRKLTWELLVCRKGMLFTKKKSRYSCRVGCCLMMIVGMGVDWIFTERGVVLTI